MGDRTKLNEKSKHKCKICELMVKNEDDGVGCDGPCNRWFHRECVKMSRLDYTKLDDLKEVAIWMCDADKCRLKDWNKMVKQNDEINKKLELILKSMEILNNKVELLKKSNETVKDSVNDREVKVIDEIKKIIVNKDSYADKVKKDVPIMIIPKKKQEVNVTKQLMKGKIDPVELKIVNVSGSKNGTVALISKDKDVEKVKVAVEEKMGEDYEVKIKELLKPRILIHGLGENMEVTMLEKKLKDQNEIMDGMDLKCIKIVKHKKGELFNAIIEVNSKGYQMILERGKVNIGWERCPVYEDIGVRRCYNCLGFSNIAKDCKDRKVCKKCTGEHDLKVCVNNKVEKCTNCIGVNEKLKLNLDVNHEVMSKECPAFKRKLEVQRKRIDY